MDELLPTERVIGKILFIRGQKVILDRDLADFYGVATKVLKQAVRRNIDRFPSDFMFELDSAEFMNWRSQFVTSNSDKMGIRHKPYAFTEQGVAMLSAVLRTNRSVNISIMIMRAFVRLRDIISSNKNLAERISELESKYDSHDDAIIDIIRTLKQLMSPAIIKKNKIGFRT